MRFLAGKSSKKAGKNRVRMIARKRWLPETMMPEPMGIDRLCAEKPHAERQCILQRNVEEEDGRMAPPRRQNTRQKRSIPGYYACGTLLFVLKLRRLPMPCPCFPIAASTVYRITPAGFPAASTDVSIAPNGNAERFAELFPKIFGTFTTFLRKFHDDSAELCTRGFGCLPDGYRSRPPA